MSDAARSIVGRAEALPRSGLASRSEQSGTVSDAARSIVGRAEALPRSGVASRSEPSRTVSDAAVSIVGRAGPVPRGSRGEQSGTVNGAAGSFTVGFDLDMTLIDPRRGLMKLFDVLAAESGIPLDGRAFVTRLGPPLNTEFERYGLDAAAVDHLVTRYRELYAELVVPLTTAMPGARESLQAVADHGGRSIVVTAKHQLNALQHLQKLGLNAAEVIGGLWSAGKAVALAEHGAEVYVGDHVGDVAGARAADAFAVGVATGPISRADLADAGADVVLGDLTEFPAWLGNYLVATVH